MTSALRAKSADFFKIRSPVTCSKSNRACNSKLCFYMRYFTRPLGPEPRRRTLSFAGFITKTVRLYRGASSSRKTLLRNLFREPFTVLARLASGPLVNSYHTDHKKGRAKKLSLFCGRGDGIRALGGRARKTADVCCFVVGRYLRPAQAMLAGLPSNPVSPLLDIQKRESQKGCIP